MQREGREKGVGRGGWLCGILPRGGSLRPSRGTSNWTYLFLALFPDSFWMYRDWEGNKKHIIDDCRTALVWPCVRGPPRILFLLVGVDGSCVFHCRRCEQLLHRRGFLASLARRHLLYKPIDWLIDAPVVPVD
jgi:hypothetical protein